MYIPMSNFYDISMQSGPWTGRVISDPAKIAYCLVYTDMSGFTAPGEPAAEWAFTPWYYVEYTYYIKFYNLHNPNLVAEQ